MSFSHNILFDYAVSVLLMEDDPPTVCAFLADDPSRPLFLRPSVDYYFTRLWYVRPQAFWDVLWFMLRAPQTHVRVYARLVPMTVMAREAREVAQLRPLFGQLAEHGDVAPQAMLHLLQVVRGLFKGQRDALWSALLRRAAESLQHEFAWELATLTFDILERAQRTGQRAVIDDCARVGRRLLQWVWSERSQRCDCVSRRHWRCLGGPPGVPHVRLGSGLLSRRSQADPWSSFLTPHFPSSTSRD